MARAILREKPQAWRLAVIVRGCDERAIVELVKRNQIDRERLLTIGYACDGNQAKSLPLQPPVPSEARRRKRRGGRRPPG